MNSLSLCNLLVLIFLNIIQIGSTLKLQDCEVCITFLSKFSNSLTSKDKESTDIIEEKFKEFCVKAVGKENRFCYYIGGSVDSATGILKYLSKPLSWGMPSEKVCERLKKKDGQICQLSYEKQIDFKTVDLKKLKVRELKKILSDWDESCNDCIEKGDFIKKIDELKHTYVAKEEL